jgi:hypothetical protein
MKSIIRFGLIVLMITNASESFGQLFGIKAGLNLSTMLKKDNINTYSDDYKLNPDFHLGMTAEFPLNEILSLETGFVISPKGYRVHNKETVSGEPYETKVKANLLYFDIPLTAKAAFSVENARIFVFTGPYTGVGIRGKIKSEVTSGGSTIADQEDINWGSGEQKDLRRFDFGLTFGAGIEVNSVQIGLSYGLGLANISPVTDGGRKISNRVLAVSAGYRFGEY